MIKKAFASLLLVFAAIAFGAWLPRSPAVAPFTPSQRSIFNVNFMDGVYDYEFIDHVMTSGGGIVPIPSSNTSPAFYYGASDPLWSTDAAGAHLDGNGYPQNFAQANGVTWGSHILVPSSANYGATVGHGYVIMWSGDCQLSLTTGTWTTQSHTADPNYVLNGNGNWTGTNQTIVATYSGAQQQIGWRVTHTGQFGNGYCHGIHIVRQDDLTDFNSGLIFRAGYKNIIVAQDPSAIRCMNWHGGNNSLVNRWENRAPFPSALYGGTYSSVSLPYGQTAGTAPVYTLAAVSGTPASMQHGELVTARIGNTIPRLGNFPLATAASSTPGAGQTQFTVSITKTGTTNGTTTISGISITNLSLGMSVTGADIPANTIITNLPTSTSITISQAATGSNVGESLNFGHGFLTGDIATFRTNTATGWTRLNFQNVAVTVVDTNTFYVTLDTTGYGSFAPSSSFAGPYISLQVGSGNDRTSYPVVDTQGYISIAMAGSANFMHASDYRTFTFDKTIFASRDSSGNPIAGAWLVQGQSDSGTSLTGFAVLGTPVEVCATLVKEVNALNPAKPVHLWMNTPAMALMSMDPDYSAGSNYTYNPINAAKAILPASIHLFNEYSNETWNGPSITFTQNQYLMERALYRASQPNGVTSYSYMTSLRSSVMVNDVTAAIGNDSRVHFVLAGQGAVGMSNSPNSGNVNTLRAFGTGLFYRDAAITALPQISLTGTTHTSTVLDGLSSTASLAVGMGIVRSDVPAGTQIQSITNSTSLLMTAAATGSNSGTSVSFESTPISYHYAWAFASYFDPPTSHTASFTGVISGTTLTVSGISGGTLAVGDFVVGSGVSTNPNTTITAFGSGTGSNGTYTVSVSQSVASEAMTKNQYMAYTAGTGTFTDDSAMYNGTDNSVPNGGGNYSGAANPTQAIANLTAQVVSGGDSQSVNLYQGITTQYSGILAPLGIQTIQYEGAYEINGLINATYGSHVITSADQAFILAWQASASWSTAQQNFFTAYRANTSTVMPALYVMLSCQWGYGSTNCTGDTNVTTVGPDTYSGGVEGGSLNRTWTDNGTANQSLN